MAEVKPIKKRKKMIDTVEMNAKDNDKDIDDKKIDSVSENKTEIRYDNNVLSTSNKKFANVINFAELQNIMLQNVSKTTTKSYTQFTKEKLSQYLSNPTANIDNIREVSQYIYLISPQYKTLVNYCANMLLYSYNVTYKTKDWNKAPKLKDFMKQYQELCTRLDNMGLEQLSANIVATSIRDGIYVGFAYDDGNSFYMKALDPKYCKISALTEKNTYLIKFNAAYFDEGNNKDFLYGINNDGVGVWDNVFIEGYENYKDNGRDFQWFELPAERTICIICGEDANYPLPFFFGVMQDLLDILDYRDLIRSKTELENYVLLISKIPLLKNSDNINDFAVDLGLVQATQSAIDETLPSLIGSAYTPCDVEKITFDNQNQVQQNNVYDNSISSLFNSIGISQMLFNDEKGGSIGLRHSIRVDESTMFEFLRKLQSNIQRYIQLNITDEFIFKYHFVTIFGQDDYISSLKDMASLGLPCKTDLATVLKSPLEMINATYMENAIGLDNLWKPLSSSYTQSSTDKKAGGQTKKDDDLSEEGIDTREKGKNDGTKSK